MAQDFDAAVVGSGPSGALAAWRLVREGLRVLMLDVAHDDERSRSLVPDRPFSELRRSDPDQGRYFLGDGLEGVPEGELRVGAQLTPPRQFVTRGTEEHLPLRPGVFAPMQSLALGGLGATWGAASFTYTEAELRQAGIHEPDFERFYSQVCRRVGISADAGDDASRLCFAGVSHSQPALEIDSVAREVWSRYRGRRDDLARRGLLLGRTPLAVLSRDLGGRLANPYFDMDFWSESRRSIFRPRYLIEELLREPGFALRRGQLVLRFEDEGDRGVAVHCRDLEGGGFNVFRARRLLLCAGAINSARIALNSAGRVRESTPVLCNPYTYAAGVCWPRLGRASTDRRHSLSQLVAVYRPPDDPDDFVTAQLYSYRSLLLFKLVKEIPLPPWAGLLVARLLVDSLAILGIHHSDAPGPRKRMRIRSEEKERLPELEFDHEESPEELQRREERERQLVRMLRGLGILCFSRFSPGAAASIHYAGTIPIREEGAGWGSRPDGRLLDARRVYVADSSGWRYLPAKGLTFTLMANAVRVAEHVIRDLGSGR